MDSVGLSLFDGKICQKCGLWQPIKTFDVAKSCQDGRRPNCRPCERPAGSRTETQRKWREENRDHIRAYKRKCYHSNPEKTKEAAQRVYSRHRDKILARSRQWAIDNPERYKQRLKEYGQKHQNELREKRVIWVEKKKAELGEAWYENIRERARLWRKNNPEKRRAIHANANARRKRQSEGTWTAEEFAAVCDHYGNVCLCCGKAKKLHADHVIPLIKGGRNDIGNLQPLCHSCNSRKNVKDTDYRPDGGSFAREMFGL
jgi:5-methylcytosine-specific restriction endonuclease McrA